MFSFAELYLQGDPWSETGAGGGGCQRVLAYPAGLDVEFPAILCSHSTVSE